MSTLKQDIYISRVCVIDRDFKIFGYKLLFLGEEKEKADVGTAESQKVVKFVADFGIEKFVGEKYGFISIDEKIIDEDLLDILQNDKIIFELNIKNLDKFIYERLKNLKTKGYKFAIDESLIENFDFIDVFDIVEVNPHIYLNYQDLESRVKQFKKLKKIIMALNITSNEEFKKYSELGFDLFLGNFIEKDSEVIKAKNYLSPSKNAVLELYNKILSDADLEEIEVVFKKNPDLSYKLLKLVNSAYFGLRNKVSSIRHALVLLGLKNLRKWVLFMLYAEDFSDIKSNPFFVQSILRAKIMEKLCSKICDEEQSEKAFLTGMISNLNVVLGVSKEEMLKDIGVEDDIKSAVLNREGKIGKLLALTEGLENQDFDTVVSISKELQIPMTDILMAETLSILEIEKTKY